MNDLLLHERTAASLKHYTDEPSHALLLVGPVGIGKSTVAINLAAQLQGITTDKLANYPYISIIRPEKERSISIEAIRTLEHYMALKTPGSSRRIAIIEDAHYLTQEAQNALLKTLEEPPANTVLILTAASEQALLPTIRSRAQTIMINRPDEAALREFFGRSYDGAAVRQALLISGGLPGLTTALLASDETHPLVSAAQIARDVLQKSAFERLTLVDGLSKQRETVLDVCLLLQHMSHIALSSGSAQAKKWQKILSVSYQAVDRILQNAQLKLVLTDLMLNL